MKFNFEKQVTGGKYYVRITVAEILPEEKENIVKFGSPLVPIDPQYILYRGIMTNRLPLPDLNQVFIFNTEDQANLFVEGMKVRIKESVDGLRSKKDHFSKMDEYEV